MTSYPDLKRWADLDGNGPAELRDLLREGQQDLPEPHQLRALAERLGPILTTPLEGAGASPEPREEMAGQPPRGVGAKLLIGAGTAGGLLLGALWLLPGSAEKEAASLPSAMVSSSAAASVQLSPAINGPISLPPQASESAEPEPPRLSASAATVSPRSALPAASMKPKGSVDAESGPSESALLEQARAALARNPERALALTREHQRRFPQGALAQEREVIAIHALEGLNRQRDAQRRAQGFEASFPGSPHRPITGEPPRSTPSGSIRGGNTRGPQRHKP